MKRSKGFTLIELLMVISIIGLLSSVVLSSLNSARERARLAAGKQFEANIQHSAGDQLVGEWLFNNSLADTSGNRDTAIFQGSAAFVTDSERTAAGFVGANGTDFVNVGNFSVLNFGPRQDFTLGAWVKPTSFITGGGTIMDKGANSGNLAGYRLSLEPGQFKLTIGDGTTRTQWNTFAPYATPLQKWSYIAVVINRAGTADAYANGVRIGSVNVSAYLNSDLSNASPFRIGHQANVSWWDGSIDNVRVYAKSLTAFEIQKMYAEGLITHNDLAMQD